MAYTKQVWSETTPITPEALNHMEDGISNSQTTHVITLVADIAPNDMYLNRNSWDNLTQTRFKFEAALWPGNFNGYLEVVYVGVAHESNYDAVKLYDLTAGAEVTGVVIHVPNPASTTPARIRSAAFTPIDGHEYCIKCWRGNHFSMYAARLLFIPAS